MNANKPQGHQGQRKKPKANWYPPWAPRFWNGMSTGSYLELLKHNRFQVHPARYPMMVLVSGCSVVNSSLNRLQKIFYSAKIDATRIEQPPVFIIGHWRSGTTLMHELISLDERFAFPSNFEAFVPKHFLLTRHVMYPLINLLMPGKRPMDSMTMNASSPQEDDFALCSYGAPTPYRRIAFPNNRGDDHLQLDPDRTGENQGQSDEQVKEALTHFYKSLTLRYAGRQLVLKSPPHTARLDRLAEWFPGAKFVHVSRHPHKLVSSTMRLWRLLDEIQGFQLARYDDQWLKNYVFQCQSLMYDSYFRHRDALPENQLAEIRFEDLIQSPTDTLQKVYQQLEIGDFAAARPAIEKYFADRKGHRTNPVELNAELVAEIDSHWRPYAEAFGYL